MLFEIFLAQLLGTSPAPPPPVLSEESGACPSEMRLIEGIHYEYVQRLCLSFRGDHCYAFLPGLIAQETRATGVRACMDTYEWPNKKGESPAVMDRFVDAEAKCASVGKRLCSEFEWELACEGPDTLPFPYGYQRESKACNTDKPYMSVSESKLASMDRGVRDAEARRAWQGESSGSYPRCASAFGVMDLIGNVEEWVSTSRPEWPYRSSLKGGYWAKPWAGCRGTNESHAPMFRFYEVGFRCCKVPEERAPSSKE